MARKRIGLITVGQGPRPELDRVHRRLFETLGAPVELVARHALDGWDEAALAAIAAGPDDAQIHAFVHGVAEREGLLGPGWVSHWVRQGALNAPIQRCIDRLEREDCVEASIVCVAEDFPPGSFTARQPLAIPYRTMLDHAKALAAARTGATVAMLVNGPRQRAQQETAWNRHDWTRDLRLAFIEISGDPLGAAAKAASLSAALVMVCAYSVGLGPNDPSDLPDRMQEAAGAPVMIPAMAACSALNPLLSAKR